MKTYKHIKTGHTAVIKPNDTGYYVLITGHKVPAWLIESGDDWQPVECKPQYKAGDRIKIVQKDTLYTGKTLVIEEIIGTDPHVVTACGLKWWIPEQAVWLDDPEEQEWVIESFSFSREPAVPCYKLDYRGLYTHTKNILNGNTLSDYSLNYMLYCLSVDGLAIYSARADKNAEIFTIGDHVACIASYLIPEAPLTIDRFVIEHNKILAVTERYKNGIDLRYLRKYTSDECTEEKILVALIQKDINKLMKIPKNWVVD